MRKLKWIGIITLRFIHCIIDIEIFKDNIRVKLADIGTILRFIKNIFILSKRAKFVFVKKIGDAVQKINFHRNHIKGNPSKQTKKTPIAWAHGTYFSC